MQTGSTCGLHAVNHLLASASHLTRRSFPILTKASFEHTALAGNLGEHSSNLVQPGGSNYDVAVLALNLTRLKLSTFPLTPADIEGSPEAASVVPGGRLVNLFQDYIISEGVFKCVGYLLRIPTCGGHWISVVPVSTSSVPLLGHVRALLCDSLYSSPFMLTQHQAEDMLTACAIDAAHASIDAFNTDWGCFLIGTT